MTPGKEIYISQTYNIIGLYGIYYQPGRITLKFSEAYEMSEDEGYYDFSTSFFTESVETIGIIHV